MHCYLQAAGIVDEIDMLGISGEAQSTVFENGNSNSRNLNPTSQQSSPDIDAMFGNAQPQVTLKLNKPHCTYELGALLRCVSNNW